ncbi:MAG TPA: SRPBCC family protein [Planctomycetota bacterium]|nr:SRPBCC family protein [Planctomycetota bacterium]
MIWIAYIVGGLIGLVVLMAILGSLLPRGHSATRRATFRRPATEVWSAITDIDKFTTWRSDLASVERLPDRDGRPVWREKGRNGTMTLEQVESRPPSRFVGRIADKNLPFGGTWTYELTEAAGSTTLAITEDGEVYNVVFRFMARFIFGYAATMEKYLRDLGKKFGEPVQ